MDHRFVTCFAMALLFFNPEVNAAPPTTTSYSVEVKSTSGKIDGLNWERDEFKPKSVKKGKTKVLLRGKYKKKGWKLSYEGPNKKKKRVKVKKSRFKIPIQFKGTSSTLKITARPKKKKSGHKDKNLQEETFDLTLFSRTNKKSFLKRIQWLSFTGNFNFIFDAQGGTSLGGGFGWLPRIPDLYKGFDLVPYLNFQLAKELSSGIFVTPHFGAEASYTFKDYLEAAGGLGFSIPIQSTSTRFFPEIQLTGAYRFQQGPFLNSLKSIPPFRWVDRVYLSYTVVFSSVVAQQVSIGTSVFFDIF